METFLHLLNAVVHIDQSLGIFIDQYGAWVYLILFLIVFAETGLVVMPFLPGDSLLFIAGAFCANGALNEWILIFLLLAAAISGNTVNYWVGSYIGPKVFERNWRFLDHSALEKTHRFYQKHGGKTLILARFLPIFRTFAPFIAGVSAMGFSHFQFFNLVGAALWVGLFIWGGYFFGNLPFIKDHLNIIVVAGIGAAIIPLMLGGVWRLMRINYLSIKK